MMQRREFVGLIPLSAVCLAGNLRANEKGEDSRGGTSGPLITSPPVVQHPAADSFTVAFAVSALSTGWVQWGLDADHLDRRAVAHRHGLICAGDRSHSIPVSLADVPPGNRTIFYRVVAQPLAYRNAYQLQRGEPQSSDVFRLQLPDRDAAEITIAIVNDTHEQPQTIAALHRRIEEINPELLVWNGDTCNDFDAQDDPMQIVLNPAGDVHGGWASQRPLLFVPGNHDVRGARARELSDGLSGWPGQSELPYNFALRLGPVALVGLDTGEDKPDAHPVFAGTAAYQPYRKAQAEWLKSVVARPEVAGAPLRVAVCHIPLRGLPGDNDGTTLEGYAAYSGAGARLWMPTLRQAGFQAVVSGHTHRHRIDDPSDTEPLMQAVGGGPQPERATLTILRAGSNDTTLRIENLAGEPLLERSLGI